MQKSFDVNAKNYAKSARIQKILATKLVLEFEKICKFSNISYSNIADVGCGTGALYRLLLERNLLINKSFTAIDLSQNMLALHPEKTGNSNEPQTIKKINRDFQNIKIEADVILSNAALQWAEDLEKTLQNLHFEKLLMLNILTSNSLANIHNHLNTPSPLISKDEILAILHRVYGAHLDYKIYNVKLEFLDPTQREMPHYLKLNGLLGGGNIDFKTKRKLLDLPSGTSFETIFAIVKKLNV